MSVKVQIDTTGLNEAVVREQLAGALESSAAEVERRAKINVLSDLNNTGLSDGTLAGSIEHRTDRAALSATVGTEVIYGSVHEYGAVIEAKNAPYLVFKTADEQWHSVKSVTIPARPWLQPALDSSEGFIQAQVDAAVMRAMV